MDHPPWSAGADMHIDEIGVALEVDLPDLIGDVGAERELRRPCASAGRAAETPSALDPAPSIPRGAMPHQVEFQAGDTQRHWGAVGPPTKQSVNAGQKSENANGLIR
jgi:hypothetical protein